jgi:hypothetical protein
MIVVIVACTAAGAAAASVARDLGMHQVTWPELWRAFVMLVVTFAIPLTLLVMTFRRRRFRRTLATRGFAVEVTTTELTAS